MKDYSDYQGADETGANDLSQLHREMLLRAMDDAVRAAAERGDAEAQFSLGCRCDAGEGVPQDHAKAAEWYRKAAEQGHAGAQFNLGVSYAQGEGVPQDHAKAAEWYRKAAEQGHGQAQYNLGVRYFNGEGVSRSWARAVEWLEKAAEQQIDGAADALEKARRKLQEETEEAERRRRQETAERRDVSMEIGALIALAVFLAGTPLYVWTAEHHREIAFLLRPVLQLAAIAAAGLGGCAGLALLLGGFSEVLTIPGGIAGLAGGLITIFCYEDPDVYRKAKLAALALIALTVIRIVYKKLRK